MAHVRKSVVGLRVCGENLVPNEITELLGTKPTHAQTKGDILGTTGKTRVAKTGMWRLQASDREPENMDGQIREILEQLTSDLNIWRTIATQYDLDLFCGLFLGGSNEGLTLSAESISAIGVRAIKLDLDIYSSAD